MLICISFRKSQKLMIYLTKQQRTKQNNDVFVYSRSLLSIELRRKSMMMTNTVISSMRTRCHVKKHQSIVYSEDERERRKIKSKLKSIQFTLEERKTKRLYKFLHLSYNMITLFALKI